jgi:hypothetical protein
MQVLSFDFKVGSRCSAHWFICSCRTLKLLDSNANVFLLFYFKNCFIVCFEWIDWIFISYILIVQLVLLDRIEMVALFFKSSLLKYPIFYSFKKYLVVIWVILLVFLQTYCRKIPFVFLYFIIFILFLKALVYHFIFYIFKYFWIQTIKLFQK